MDDGTLAAEICNRGMTDDRLRELYEAARAAAAREWYSRM
jgi:hypothetical protein